MGIPYKKQYVKSDGRKLVRSGPRDMQARVASGGYSPDSELVALLTNQIAELKAEILALKSKTTTTNDAPQGFFTPEQVDEEIRKAVEAAVAEAAISFKGQQNQESDLAPLVQEYKKQIVELQKGNDNLTRLHATMAKENTDLKTRIAKLETEATEAAELKKKIAVLEQEIVGKQELIETLKSSPAILGDEVIDPDRPQMEQVFVDPLEDDAGEGLKSSIQIETVVKDDEVDDKVNKLKDLLGKSPLNRR